MTKRRARQADEPILCASCGQAFTALSQYGPNLDLCPSCKPLVEELADQALMGYVEWMRQEAAKRAAERVAERSSDG